MQKYCKYSGKELLRSIKRKKNLVSALASHSENVIEIPTNDHSISVKDDYCKITKKNASHSENVIETPTNDHSISVKDDYYKITKKNNIIDFCCDILQELDGKYNIHPFYKYDEKETAIKNPIDLFTINSKLENNQYTSIKEFEKDIRLIFCNCYAYNNIESDIYYLGKELESVFNKIWTKKIISYAEQKEKLKRV
ncbi:Bdf1p [Rhizophagus irregularis DAOM 197198w]|uniref:Bdf1p n=1 Tax=Rhizophagus irregularis (strain DAOM 197198w) TaxID=1432141 RepID=A0A015J3F7_RHIIW|nr:Bdf1p [Rhizophagus irregularis DAOM 197198w]